MSGTRAEVDLFAAIDPDWPPLDDVREGWQALDEDGRARVRRRLAAVLAEIELDDEANEAAVRGFLSFLAQVEPIAIDVPLQALADAEGEDARLHERQLADEVFHALLFAHLAERHGGLAEPIGAAEDLLAEIRAPEDPAHRAVLLNLIAEAWFETLFEHAAEWGLADQVFEIALADEERHVEEGHVHAADVDPEEIEDLVRDFEEKLFALVQHPRILLPILELAGEDAVRDLSRAYLATHEQALAEIGLEPPEAVDEMAHTLAELENDTDGIGTPTRIDPETNWRQTALHLWDTPRNPVMHGWFDVETEPIPDELLTPIAVAAVGRVWHEYPRVNRYTLGDEIYEPDGVNVGVRVTLGDDHEALSTIVVPDAHERSVTDIQRILEAGVHEMNRLGRQLEPIDPTEETEPLRAVLRDEELMSMVPPETVAAPVTVANSGPSGMVAGFGAMPGALGQSVEFVLGRIEQRPSWNGDRYVPADHVTVGCSADHRVIDGHHAGRTMDRLQTALSEDAVDEILTRDDTIPADADLGDVALSPVGMGTQQVELMMSCKLPFWLGWMCWLFKK
jgi:hypothetical protein